MLSEKRGQTPWGGPLRRRCQARSRTFQHPPRAMGCGTWFEQSSGRSVDPWGTWDLKLTIRSFKFASTTWTPRRRVPDHSGKVRPLLSLYFASETEPWLSGWHTFARLGPSRCGCRAAMCCPKPLSRQLPQLHLGSPHHKGSNRALQEQRQVIQQYGTSQVCKQPVTFSSLTIGCEGSRMLVLLLGAGHWFSSIKILVRVQDAALDKSLRAGDSRKKTKSVRLACTVVQ